MFAPIKTYAEIRALAAEGKVDPAAVYILDCPSGALRTGSRYQTTEQVTPGTGNTATVIRQITIAIPDTVEKDNGEALRGSVKAACDAEGYQYDAGGWRVIQGSRIPSLIKRIDSALAQVNLYNAGAVHCHVKAPTPRFVAVDAGSLAGMVAEGLTDVLARCRRALKLGTLPAPSGDRMHPAYGQDNLRSIENLIKGMERGAPTAAIAAAVEAAQIEVRQIAKAIWDYAEPKGAKQPRPQAEVTLFASGLATPAIDSAIGQIAPADHSVWADLGPAPSADPAAALADAPASAPGAASEGEPLSDLASLL